MAGNKYIAQESGVFVQHESVQTSAGVADAGKIVALNGTGTLDITIMPPGIGADTAVIVASEALAAGDIINIHNVGGAARVRKADATAAGKYANGFVLAGVVLGGNATVYFEGTNNQMSGLTPGVQFLATTAGTTTDTAPSGSGNVNQVVGFAVSSTEMNFQSRTPVVIA